MLSDTSQYAERPLDPAPRLVLFVAVVGASEMLLLALGELLGHYGARSFRAGDAGYYLDLWTRPVSIS